VNRPSKVNQDQASEPSMEEEQVDPIPLVSYPKTFLAGDEREFAT
jgi:hypothetical protein